MNDLEVSNASATSSSPPRSSSGSSWAATARALGACVLATALYLHHDIPLASLVTVLAAAAAPFDPRSWRRERKTSDE
jgi:hypothetical protein